MPTTKRTKMTVERLAEIIDNAMRDYESRLDGVCGRKITWNERHESIKRQRRYISKVVLKAIAEAK